MTKKKILLLSDHALSTSGVGVQSRFLIEGLLQKYPGEWTFRQFGAAIKHDNYDTVVVNDDFVIKPIDGFGTKEMLRITLATEKPDIVMLFTDPRFFLWLFEMEDEIHQMCPIVWWHVWDNYPQPAFNDVLYDATDLINCHSYLTYEMCNAKFGNKTNFIPHAFPPEIYHPIDDSEAKKYKAECLGPERKDDFVVLWVNRNAKRKRPNDLLLGWQKFINLIKEKYGKTDATLLMHTDPHDGEGPNLLATTEHLGIVPHVVYSNERIDFNQMRIIHNVVDCCVNISFAEGFGLATLESMLCGKPIIAVKTGGLTRQVVNHLDDSENGVALPVVLQSLVGSQTVPYIYEDYASTDDIASAFLKLYEMSPAERKKLGEKARNYALSEFSFDKTVELWNDTLKDTLENWKSTYNRVNCEEL